MPRSRTRSWISFPVLALAMLPSCGTASEERHPGEASGGAGIGAGTGGSSVGGALASGGTVTLGGGAGGGRAGGSGAVTAGGATGGTPTTGRGGIGPGGGTSATGGLSGTGGAPSSGSTGSGGSAGSSGSGNPGGAGGASTGGAGGGATCPFPTSFQWTSTGPLAEPKSPSGHDFVSLKDFTVVHWNNQFVVYATVFDKSSSWSGVNINFTDWTQAGAAPQTYMGSTPTGATVAPTLFYFTPKNVWVLTYQWGFKYSTATDPTKPSTWSAGKTLLSGDPTGGSGTGPIDQTVICDGNDCYLFFAGDNGHIYRASMPIGSFPGTFSNATSILSDSQNNLFEAVQVYTVKGSGKYLMIVEAIGGGGRYFRAFSASSLGGTFAPVQGASTEATPFAGKSNVTFSGTAWTNDISHGDIVRDDPSETQTIDPCNLQFLYQGRDPKSTASYNELPYRPGLLTKK